MSQPHWTMRKPAIPVTRAMIDAGESTIHQWTVLSEKRDRDLAVSNILSYALKVVTKEDLRTALGEGKAQTEADAATALQAALFNADGTLNIELLLQAQDRMRERMLQTRGNVLSHTCTEREGIEHAICRTILRMLDPHAD